MPSPHVSVVVPVRDRRDLLAKLLDGLAAQTYRDFELIVVDDGSTDGSAELAGLESRFPTRVVRRSNSGAVAAREAGVARATGVVLAFTDSDCVPDPTWLATGVAATDDGVDVVMGHTRAAGERRVLERSLHAEDNGLYPTCNVFYRRAAFDAAGGFDLSAGGRLGFRLGGRANGLGLGEDTLLGWRVRRAGRAAYAPDAVVLHAVLPADVRDYFSRTLQVGAFPALVKEVPELRVTLLKSRFFLGDTSRLMLYFAAVAALAGFPVVAAAEVLGFVFFEALKMRKRNGSLKRKALAFPIILAGEFVTLGALVTGSIRARTVVL